MMQRRTLGCSTLEVGRIGISSSFGAETGVYHEALERGCNYFNWGTFIKGRSAAFRTFFSEIVVDGKRDKVFLGLLSYSHSGLLGDIFLISALRKLGTDYVDGLVLGYYPKRPPQRVLDWAQKAKAQGMVRAIGMTTHNRRVVAPLAQEGLIDYFHVRYNAVHRGAEQDIFARSTRPGPGLVSFTATCWGQLLKQKKMPPDMIAPAAGDCYRFVLSREEIDICMMGVRNQSMLRENLQIIEKGVMSAEELAYMHRIGDHIHGKPRQASVSGLVP